jgi:hypothetical protein
MKALIFNLSTKKSSIATADTTIKTRYGVDMLIGLGFKCINNIYDFHMLEYE